MTFQKIIGIVFIATVCAQADLATIDWEHISGGRSSPPYGWNFSYDIGFFNSTLMVDVDIRLTGYDPDDALLTRWEDGIEDFWSTDQLEVPIDFNVDWVTTDFDQSVTVINSTGRWNMSTWYTVGAGGWGDAYQEEVAAHEFGHMLALYDEYAGGAIDPVTQLVNTGGIMATLNGGAFDYYYDDFLTWYHENSAAVPEPFVLQLYLIGFMTLIGVRKRFGFKK